MRLKLAHKLVLINTVIIVVLTSAFISLSYFSSKSMYSDALNGIDREVIKNLAATLGTHYEQHQSWNTFIDDPAQWNKTVDGTFFSVFFRLMAEVAEDRGEPLPAPPSGFQEMPKWEFPFGTFFQRLSLLDPQKQPLIQPEILNQAATYQRIKANGETVGWLRIGSIDVDMLPLAQYFFDQQLKIVLWSAVIGGLFAILLTFILSRHITAPIKRLTEKAKQIAKRDFTGVVTVNTGDELQELAVGFNSISQELDIYQHRQKQWLMDVSHELKAPLTVLVGEVFAICDDLSKCDESTAELLQKEALRIKRIADDLYQLCQIEEMGIQLRRTSVAMAPLIKEQIDSYAPRLGAKQIVVKQDYAPSPASVFADADRIAQVFVNLLENCLRYTDSHGILSVTEVVTADQVLLAFEDSGPGVPDESLPRLFDRLYRMKTTSGNHLGGAGLGLAICKEIIIAHGGTITANHGSSGGLRIEIALPRHEDAHHE
jgi:two-component system sensor histidine kinase BaeS